MSPVIELLAREENWTELAEILMTAMLKQLTPLLGEAGAEDTANEIMLAVVNEVGHRINTPIEEDGSASG